MYRMIPSSAALQKVLGHMGAATMRLTRLVWSENMWVVSFAVRSCTCTLVSAAPVIKIRSSEWGRNCRHTHVHRWAHTSWQVYYTLESHTWPSPSQRRCWLRVPCASWWAWSAGTDPRWWRAGHPNPRPGDWKQHTQWVYEETRRRGELWTYSPLSFHSRQFTQPEWPWNTQSTLHSYSSSRPNASHFYREHAIKIHNNSKAVSSHAFKSNGLKNIHKTGSLCNSLTILVNMNFIRMNSIH